MQDDQPAAERAGAPARDIDEGLYSRLHRIAKRYFRQERADHTLQATALVNEAYLRVVRDDAVAGRETTHLMRCAANGMRQLLIQHARSKSAEKRGGRARRSALDSDLATPVCSPHDRLDIEEALDELHDLHERQAAVVRMRYFRGHTEVAIAEELGVTDRTVRNDLRAARAWLHARLSGGFGGE